MKTFITRSLICLILVFVWQLIPISHQVNSAAARNLASPPAVDDLKGTVWTGTVKGVEDCPYEYRFAADGSMSYQSEENCEADCGPDECTEPTGSWKQVGDSFTATVEFKWYGKKNMQKLAGVIKGDRLEFTRKNYEAGKLVGTERLRATRKQ